MPFARKSVASWYSASSLAPGPRCGLMYLYKRGRRKPVMCLDTRPSRFDCRTHKRSGPVFGGRHRSRIVFASPSLCSSSACPCGTTGGEWFCPRTGMVAPADSSDSSPETTALPQSLSRVPWRTRACACRVGLACNVCNAWRNSPWQPGLCMFSSLLTLSGATKQRKLAYNLRFGQTHPKPRTVFPTQFGWLQSIPVEQRGQVTMRIKWGTMGLPYSGS